jgi:hypothetical protein
MPGGVVGLASTKGSKAASVTTPEGFMIAESMREFGFAVSLASLTD